MPLPLPDPVRRAVHAAWRAESGRIVATVARLVRDVGLAEDLAQDAVEAALRHWPTDGVPHNPAAWLTATAKNRALDHLRRAQVHARVVEGIGQDLDAREAHVVPDFVDALDAARQDVVGDDLLRLIFIACHPVLSPEARVALTLKMLCGLSTADIARAHLLPEPTIAQRIVRAKRTLSRAGVPFELPPGPALSARLGDVLQVVYLIFNEGYSASSGPESMRPDLSREALRLGGLLTGLAAQEPEVHGLDALMALQAARGPARTDARGHPVLLMDQDRSRWDHALTGRGLAALGRAQAILESPPFGPRGAPGPYVLQAAIAACHARAPTAEATDWPCIARLYADLERQTRSPVVVLNRAVAVGMAEGPAAALALTDPLTRHPAMLRYPWLHSVRADLLQRLGETDAARAALAQAIALQTNDRERGLLQRRLADLEPIEPPSDGDTTEAGDAAGPAARATPGVAPRAAMRAKPGRA